MPSQALFPSWCHLTTHPPAEGPPPATPLPQLTEEIIRIIRIIGKNHRKSSLLTEEIIGREVVGVPHLQGEPGRDLVLGLVPGEHGLLFGDDDLLLRRQVVEGEDVTPVEVALAGQRVVVDVRVLLVLLLALQPPAGPGGVTGVTCPHGGEKRAWGHPARAAGMSPGQQGVDKLEKPGAISIGIGLLGVAWGCTLGVALQQPLQGAAWAWGTRP